MRWLSVGRLSHTTDVSTSPERQREMNAWAIKCQGERTIAEVMDLDLSGSISPFERPELGPWLTDPDMIAQWDGIVVSKIDRLSRSLLDFEVFLRWCDDHGKALISVSEGFDLSTPIGRLIAKLLMMFAEFERERMRERRSEAAEKLRALGRWNGGKAPYGYVLKEDRAGAFLYQDPDTAPVVWRIVQMVVAGRYLAGIARMLNAEGIPSPGSVRRRPDGRVKALAWSAAGLGRMLTNRVLLGELTFRGKPVRNDVGSPIYVTDEPLVDEATWNDLQHALAAISRPKSGNRKADHLLLRIAYCGECDAPLYYQGYQAGPKGRYAYYRCRTSGFGYPDFQHGARGISADDLEAEVEQWLLNQYGDDQILRQAGMGPDYASELALVQRELKELEEQYMVHNLSAERFARMSTRLEERQAELRVLAETAQGPQWEPTGETVRERWERSNTEDRRAMLRRLGLRWYLRREFRISDRTWRWQHESGWLPVDQSHERPASLVA
jgi:site-specific DNA recombinase